MSSTAIATIVKMMETLPEDIQKQVVEHVRSYIAEVEDDLRWDALFAKTQSQLASAARRAKQEITEGLAKPMDIGKL